MTAHTEQAMPVPNGSPSVQSMVRDDLTRVFADTPTRDAVVADLVAREHLGVERYGVALQPHNGRDAHRDLYEELLDGANYARQIIAESPSDHAVITSVYRDLLEACLDVRELMAARGRDA